MTLDHGVHAFRLRVMARAQALKNVTQACREFGISRTPFYRWRQRYLADGPDGLYPRRQGAATWAPLGAQPAAERAILALALAWPTWGPIRLATQLARPEYGGWHLALATIYRLLRRLGLNTRWQRLAVLETHSAQTAGLLTERTRRRRVAAQRRRQHAGVERLQGTILTELWRVEFRRRLFTRVKMLPDALARYLAFYNHQRPHLGYRTRGRRPAEIFWTSWWGEHHGHVTSA